METNQEKDQAILKEAAQQILSRALEEGAKPSDNWKLMFHYYNKEHRPGKGMSCRSCYAIVQDWFIEKHGLDRPGNAIKNRPLQTSSPGNRAQLSNHN
jgi:hypothetical protein